ncbi:MAG: CapA family protein [Betaproteobacteria bacterium]|nr:CapA family protein [Betaproteobacteria bacterium]
MDTLKILLTGDVMTGRGIDQVLPHPGSPLLYEPHIRDARDYVRLAERKCGPIEHALACEDLWGDALAEMERLAPDLRIVNLETAVTLRRGLGRKGIHYRMHPANASRLTAAGIDCCAGQQTTCSTRAAGLGRDSAHAACRGHAHRRRRCRRSCCLGAGGAAAGRRLGRVLVVACATESSGVPLDWAATERYSGVAPAARSFDASAHRLAAEVASERRNGAPVVVSIHWGRQLGRDHSCAHRDFAHRLIELGAADVVHGHSSHHPLAAEVYRGRIAVRLRRSHQRLRRHHPPHGDLRSDVGCLYFATIALRGGGAAAAGDRAEADPPPAPGSGRRPGAAVGREAVQLGWALPWARRSRPCPAAAAGRCNGSSGRPRHLEFERAQSLRPRRVALSRSTGQMGCVSSANRGRIHLWENCNERTRPFDPLAVDPSRTLSSLVRPWRHGRHGNAAIKLRLSTNLTPATR